MVYRPWMTSRLSAADSYLIYHYRPQTQTLRPTQQSYFYHYYITFDVAITAHYHNLRMSVRGLWVVVHVHCKIQYSAVNASISVYEYDYDICMRRKYFDV